MGVKYSSIMRSFMMILHMRNQRHTLGYDEQLNYWFEPTIEIDLICHGNQNNDVLKRDNIFEVG